jgi:homoprotocatechuate degradation regulator HpaR
MSEPQPRIANRNLPQLFLKARESLMANFRRILNHFGLTDQQWRIVRALAEHGQLEPRELCDLCQILSPSMAGMLTRMEELALIERNRVSGDQRRVLVRLAPKGEQLVSEIAPLIDQQYRQIEAVVGAQVLDELFTSLETFVDKQGDGIQAVELP